MSGPDLFPNGPLRYPVRVLFLCTGNSARSQIAEALLQHKGGERFIVASAGTHPASQVQPEAIAALRSRGIEWSRRRPKAIEAIRDDQWDLVITLCDRSRESCPTLSSRPVTAHWGIPDPALIDEPARRMTAFTETLALLSWRIDLMLALRPDTFERMVLEERIRGIALSSPPGASRSDSDRESSEELQ